MINIGALFGQSPIEPIQMHMDIVSKCFDSLKLLFEALFTDQFEEAKKIANTISKTEHKADLVKSDIRSHLPRGLFFAFDRKRFLEILTIQDGLADIAEDIAVLCTLVPLDSNVPFKSELKKLITKNLEAFEKGKLIIAEFKRLVESSFGGQEAEKVKQQINDVAFIEHECDLMQRKLLGVLFQEEYKLPYKQFILWFKIFEHISSISDRSEKLANQVRLTLELK